MAVFPKIQSPCPYKSRLASVMEGDFCRMCRRQVVDLGAMEEGERLAFLGGCEEEVCVSYRVPVRAVVAAAALAALGAASPALAQDAPAPATPAVEAEAALEDPATLEGFEEMEIIVGGIKDPSKIEFVDLEEEATLPELPVAYDEPEAPAPVSSRPGS